MYLKKYQRDGILKFNSLRFSCYFSPVDICLTVTIPISSFKIKLNDYFLWLGKYKIRNVDSIRWACDVFSSLIIFLTSSSHVPFYNKILRSLPNAARRRRIRWFDNDDDPSHRFRKWRQLLLLSSDLALMRTKTAYVAYLRGKTTSTLRARKCTVLVMVFYSCSWASLPRTAFGIELSFTLIFEFL